MQSKAKVKVAATTFKPKKTTKTYVRRSGILSGGSSTAGKSSSSNKQIMEDSADDVVEGKGTENLIKDSVSYKELAENNSAKDLIDNLDNNG
ncbi:hypothetical protein [Cytobacillus horneckiae]|uniref:hypothetical protein n=1 Tax=Cytobacillus horneckiae TaxID=549687 RepID=UPI003D9AA8DB